MSRNIFILGAGASKEVGAPLMKDFLDVAHDLVRMGKVPHSKTDFDLVAEGRAALQYTHSKSIGIDLYNMEAVFSAFEMAKMLGGLGTVDKEKVKDFPRAYRKVISDTLEQTINYKVENKKINPGVYSKLLSLVEKINSKTQGNSSILTFNYDIALDFACYFHGYQINYGLEEITPQNSFKVLKLHGSLNWTECCVCKKIVAWPLSDYFSKYSWSHLEVPSVQIPISNQFINFTHCLGSSSSGSVPYIVPPTWNKSEHHHAIESVWRHAAKELSEAENIFIIGYSLPETDTFFHYLFSLGVGSDQLIRRFWVIDPDQNVKDKYEKLLGNAVLTRFKFFNSTFGNGIDEMFSKLESEAN